MFKSIRTPLAATIVGAVVITSVIVLWLAINEHEKLYYKSVRDDLSALSRNLSEDLIPLLEATPANVAQVEKLLARLSSYQHMLYAQVYSDDKKLLASHTTKYGLSHDAPTEEFLATVLSHPLGIHRLNRQVIALERIGDQAFPLGYLVVAENIQSRVEQSRQSLLLQSFPFVVFGLLLTIGVCLFWVSRLLKPLDALSRFTQQVGETKDYSLRFLSRRENEVSRLGENINSLMEIIEVELTINQEQNHTLFEQQQTMTRLANFDSLTGLPNRQFVMDNLRLELARAKRVGEDLALMFFDLDGFKGINDSLGHETGDLILIEVADRVTSMLREGDLVARLGGDEFIIIPDRDVNETALINLATRVINAFGEPFQFRGLALTVGVSLGIAKASDADFELSQLMSNADLAMYRSKARGRGTYTIFTPDMVESHKRKMSIANSIDQAIINDEMVLYYQAKVAIDGRIMGFEALIRWQHPEFGLIMPSEFIPIAEQGGKISAITRWVIERVCMEMPLIQQQVKYKFRVAINLSGHDLRHNGLFDLIHDTFILHEVNPECIEFEVTESAYLENFAFANKFFRRLSNMGCAIALDDFGTGYSSLSYLTQITIDTLKIDRQFIRELESSERSRLVTGTIIDLAKRLSLTICAEGIENYQQWEYLLEHGCDHLQGYLFSKPIPLSEIGSLPEKFELTEQVAI
ncbi:EAL domain-containing protein [Alteromonas pelagimontana]|uniref:EAL domain-containing protein n=1 Tax=Alteromonas pelagimontana TaxID=1858656 RepID=A0A6M4M9K6_9ALTE|nr:EAL domain-containing protein [Alteromonas pelagimontana]QJR79832.1 EAL domain-containing protein [Alteromonas pelagimontana]